MVFWTVTDLSEDPIRNPELLPTMYEEFNSIYDIATHELYLAAERTGPRASHTPAEGTEIQTPDKGTEIQAA